jgi:hypothetical protein
MREYGDKCVIPRGSVFDTSPPDLKICIGIHADGTPAMKDIRRAKYALRGASHDLQIPAGVYQVGTVTKAPEYSVGPSDWL